MVEPPKGYRLIEAHEKLQEGDLYNAGGFWYKTTLFGEIAGSHYPYARKINEQS